MTESYEKTHLNEVGRMKERGHYDHALISSRMSELTRHFIGKVVKEAPFIHVAFVDPDGFPQNIPMIGAILEDKRTGGQVVYLHGHAKARLVQMLPHGSRVCLTASILDGLVLALTAFHHSMNYRSAVLHGEVEEIDEDAEDIMTGEKWEAARQIVEKVLPGRWDACRQPTKAEMQTTGFVRVNIVSASAKVRAGPPKDDKVDRENAKLVQETWTGVIPVRLTTGQPEPAEINRVQDLPQYIKDAL